MAKISNTLSYPNQLPIESGDYLIGTAANSSPIEKQTKTFTLGDIANFIIDGAFDGVSYRLPVFTAPTAGEESLTLVNSLLYQDTASDGQNPNEVGGTTVYVDNGSGQGNFYVAGSTTTNGLLTVDGGIYFNSEVFDSSNTVGTGEQVLVSQADGTVQWQNYQGSGLEFQGAWDADINNPDLGGIPLIPDNTGKYWIVSVAGGTSLPTQGGGTITDWEIGDWAIISEDLNNNIFWDKIDNSSVLTGQGTPGNLAIWVTDNELGDAAVKAGLGTNSLIFNGASSAGGDQSNAFGSASTASGINSTAMGEGTTASGDVSTAMGQSTIASGDRSVAMGQNTIASGAQSFAMGQGSAASGSNSTAMGQSTIAIGNKSFAIGDGAEASGNASIAIGVNSEASGSQSLATGTLTEASGDFSTAMGIQTKASGDNSTAMGNGTVASAYSTFASGDTTIASGIYSTAMGNGTEASGITSSAIGFGATASGDNAVALGSSTTASGPASSAMGFSTTASGDKSTAIGANTVASGIFSTAMGNGTEASGINSTAMGEDTVADGNWSTAMGDGTRASGNFSTAMGKDTTASGSQSFAIGDGAEASGTNSTAMGEDTTASGDVSTAMGKGTTASGDVSTAMGGGSTASGDFSVAAGKSNQASGVVSIAIGDANVASGFRAQAYGQGAEASGDNSFAFATVSTTTASGNGSFSFGDANESKGLDSYTLGALNIVDGALSFAMGKGNQINATANQAFSTGISNQSSGIESHAIGTQLNATDFRQIVIGSNNVPLPGSVNTWTNTHNLLTIGNGPDAANQSNALEITKGGLFKLPFYGSGLVTGIPTKSLSVDATGNVIETPTVTNTFIINGLVNDLGSQASGYDYMEWTSNVTGATQIPLFRTPLKLQLEKVTWIWMGATTLSVPVGTSVDFSIGTVPSGTNPTITNYASVSNIFSIDNSDDGTWAYGEASFAAGAIVISEFSNIGVVGVETGAITPNTGELSISFFFREV